MMVKRDVGFANQNNTSLLIALTKYPE